MEARHQCPFVNRPDARCGERLSLDHLDHAFTFCFNSFNTCPVYVERLLERRVRRTTGAATAYGREAAHGPTPHVTLVQIRTPVRAAVAS